MHQHRKAALSFLAPFLTAFIAFYLAPVLYAVYLSFFVRKRAGIGAAQEVFGGLENYLRAVQDGDFLNGLKNMFLFGVGQIPVMLGLAIILALLLDQSRGLFMKVCRTSPTGSRRQLVPLSGVTCTRRISRPLTRSWALSIWVRSIFCRREWCFFRSPTS